ncbi:pilus assembly protein CpaB [Massilia sp. WF1]|uniref:Flp pilus assembly protein CpaB n=1 Tax=unclassified Massilia TaxID=2609279 RepID=UPI00068BA3CF|nr:MULTISPECIES: Flp pilus assembly protein CpaB [unclassified Massilia]ALK95229.1 Flp pilus assembly protein CpaB [Massilia sp. WG5]KNZ67440.1 pilus assembly protein CpaB [Massilia sp. WF1]
MKNKRALIVMTIAILFGLAAVVFASRWLLNQPGGASGRIAVANADISLGQRLTPEMFRLAEWPAESVPKAAFTDLQKLSGRVLKSNLLMGEPISETKLAPAGTLGGLSALITEGKRAITVRVNDVIGVAGFALPGNYVDIIVSTQKEASPGSDSREQNISKIVLERILVLAVAQEVNRDETKPKVVNAVTLEVTPEQAEKLDLARSVGTLSLALRNQIDPQSASTLGATKLTLLPEVKPSAPPKPAPKPAPAARPVPVVVKVAAPVRRDCVSVLNGLRVTQECF